MIGILIGCLTLVVVGWAIVKGKYAPLVLFASGAFMLACAVFFDTGTFLSLIHISGTVNAVVSHK